MIIPTYEIHVETMTSLLSYRDPPMEPLWSHLIRPIFFGIWLSSCFSFWGTPFDMWVWFSYGRRWLGLHIRWWMIWYHLVFRPITHLMPYWGIFPFWLRFVDLHWFAWSSLVTRYMPGRWFAFILSWFSNEAFLESFNQAHIFLYCHDS